jgi:hypothetical protein
MSETYEITKDDIPLVMQLLEIQNIQDLADALGITTRSLGAEKMKPWRRMSIECLLRREGRWALFCQRRREQGGDKPEATDTTSSVVYKCIVCDRCLGELHDLNTNPIKK